VLKPILLILFGYLCGSISFAYIVGRLWRGIDMREYGSRKLSGSNVYEILGFPAMVATGLADVGKGVLPAWLGTRLGFELPTIVMTGLAAMAGHNWSIFLHLKGGRGIGTALGGLLVIFPWGVLWILGWLILGRLISLLAAAVCLMGIITLPVLAVLIGQPPATVWGCLGILGITIAKRVEGNRETFPAGKGTWSVLWRRLVLDRDVSDFETWAHRTPDMEG